MNLMLLWYSIYIIDIIDIIIKLLRYYIDMIMILLIWL